MSNVLASMNDCLVYTVCTVDWNRIRIAYVIGGISGLVALMGAILGTYALCVRRRRIRDRDRIPEGACGGLDDCCVSYWCGCCSLLQMFRQERITGGSYRLCSQTGVDTGVGKSPVGKNTCSTFPVHWRWLPHQLARVDDVANRVTEDVANGIEWAYAHDVAWLPPVLMHATD